MRTSRRRSSNLVRTVPVHLTRASRRRSPSLVHQVHVGHLVRTSRRRSSNLVRTVPVHLTRARRRRSPSLVHQVHVEHLVKPELSANGTCAFNENELKAKFEFRAAGKCNILRKYISITKKGEHDEQRTGKDLRP